MVINSVKGSGKFFNFIKGWHVYGLVQRAYRKYEEAIKCYRNALKFDKVCTRGKSMMYIIIWVFILKLHVIKCAPQPYIRQ